jgi:DNA-binding LytR/AlgR family response regulator
MIIDDHEVAIEVLSDYIKKVPFLSLQKVSTDPINALALLEETSVDIIFLDVEMPELSGFDFLDSLKAKMGNDTPKIIITTGYDKYAITGFDHGILDYLLKPISFKRFKLAVDRATIDIKKNKIIPENEDFLFIDSGVKKIKIYFKDIIYIEAAGNYIFIVTINGRIIVHKTMNKIQTLLPDKDFIRVHKSYISSINHIKELQGNEIIFSSNEAVKSIPISNSYKTFFLKRLKIN